MGVFDATVQFANRDGEIERDVEATVDTGAAYSVLPSEFLTSIGVTPVQSRPFEMADGRVVSMDMGEAVVKVNGFTATTIVLFGPNDTKPLLGAHALEGLGVMADPVHGRLVEAQLHYHGNHGS